MGKPAGALIGTDPAQQGRGLGSAALRSALARCDASGLPSYLEATSIRSAQLYRRLGFHDCPKPSRWRPARRCSVPSADPRPRKSAGQYDAGTYRAPPRRLRFTRDERRQHRVLPDGCQSAQHRPKRCSQESAERLKPPHTHDHEALDRAVRPTLRMRCLWLPGWLGTPRARGAARCAKCQRC